MTLISCNEELTQHLCTDNILLILFGDDAQTVAVHNKSKKMKDDDDLKKRDVPLRVKDMELLTPAQKRAWTAAPGKYVVLRVNETNDRSIISKGLVEKFITVHNAPGKLKIQRAFRGRL